MSVINTNITSMIGQQNLRESQNALQTSMERLSSGLRINSAKDDAAGQAIANRMSAQITGLSTAQRNANDGISVAQTAEGGLNQINDNLQRIRELAVQAENGTNSQDDLNSIQDEINQRLSEIDRISEETDFNGTKVLSSDEGLKIQVGSEDGQTIEVGLKQINAQTLGLDSFNVNGTGEVANRAATLSDITSQPGYSVSESSGNNYVVTETFKDVDLETLVGQLSSGDSVTVGTGADATKYTYDAEAGNFTFTEESKDFAALAKEHIPSAGNTNTGSYVYSDGSKADFTVDANGNLTMGPDNDPAYIDADGKLSSNDPSGTATQATLEDLFATAGNTDTDAGNRAINIDGQSYSGSSIGDGPTGQYVITTTGAFDGTSSAGGSALTSALTGVTGVALADGVTAGAAAAALDAATGAASVTAAINDNFKGVSVTTDGTTGFNIAYDSGVPDSATGVDVANTAISTFLETDDTVTGTATTRPAVTADASNFDGTNVNSTAAASFADTVNALTSFSGASGGDIAADASAADLATGLSAISGVTVTDNSGELSIVFDNTVSDADASAFMEALTTLGGDQISGYSNTEQGVSFTDTASVEAVLSAAAQSSEETTVDMQMGVNSSSVQFAGSAGGVGAMSTDAAYTQVYVDFDDELTTTAEVKTTYNVDPNNAEVSIVSSDGEGKYEQTAGAAVYINDQGRLTTEDTSPGDRTEDPLAALDSALSRVDSLRSELGAVQNRFESAITNLSTNETNLSAARSRIEDADYATEVANMTRAQILQQAGTSVLAQANQLPQSVLSLLG